EADPRNRTFSLQKNLSSGHKSDKLPPHAFPKTPIFLGDKCLRSLVGLCSEHDDVVEFNSNANHRKHGAGLRSHAGVIAATAREHHFLGSEKEHRAAAWCDNAVSESNRRIS